MTIFFALVVSFTLPKAAFDVATNSATGDEDAAFDAARVATTLRHHGRGRHTGRSRARSCLRMRFSGYEMGDVSG